MNRGRRLLVVGLLLAATLGLCVHYDAAREANWPYPGIEEIAENPGEYDGEQVLVIGTVRSIDREAGTAVVGNDPEYTIRVRSLERSVQPGGALQVYGTVRHGGTAIVAERVVVVNESGGARLYKLVTSLLGGLIVAGLFLWFWRIDPRSVSFEKRDRADWPRGSGGSRDG